MLLSPAVALSVMRSPSIFPKRPMTVAILREAVGADGLLLAEHPHHAPLRRALAPLFHASRTALYTSAILPHARHLAKTWASSSSVVDTVYTDVSRASMCIIGALALGTSGDDQALLWRYQSFLERHATMSHAALIATFLAPSLAKYVPLREIREARRLLAGIRSTVEEIAEERARWLEDVDSGARRGRADFLTEFLRAGQGAEAGRALSRGVVDNALTFMAAGHATTSAATCWAFFHIATHPSVQRELVAKLSAAFPDGLEGEEKDEGEDSLGACLDALPLLDATVRESLRLTPGINMTARIATEDCEICGVQITEGTVVSIPMKALQRMSSLWGSDCDEFHPQRWMEGWKQTKAPAEAWMPFLRGSRGCIGSRVALMEMKCLIAAVLLEGIFIEINPGCEPSAAGVILVPKDMSFRITAQPFSDLGTY